VSIGECTVIQATFTLLVAQLRTRTLNSEKEILKGKNDIQGLVIAAEDILLNVVRLLPKFLSHY